MHVVEKLTYLVKRETEQGATNKQDGACTKKMNTFQNTKHDKVVANLATRKMLQISV